MHEMIAQDHGMSGPPHPHHPHGGHHHPSFTRTYDVVRVEPLYIPPYYGSGVESIIAAGQCVVASSLSYDAANTLRARGWVERMDVRPAGGGKSVKTLMLCPPPAEARMSDIQPGLMKVDGGIRSLGRFYGLGETASARVRVLVQDYQDRPFTGIKVEAGHVTGFTNGNGTVVLDVPYDSSSRRITVFAHLPEGVISKEVDPVGVDREVMAFRSVEKAPQLIANAAEIGLAAGGIVVFVTGRLVKTEIVSDILTMLGEIGVIGAVFHRLGRGF